MKTSKLIISLFSTVGLMAVNAQAEDKEVNVSDVPKVVVDAFSIAKPNARVKQYELKTHDGQPVYELEFKEKGIQREYYYAADGTLLQTGEEFYPSRLPAELKQSIKASYPAVKIKGVKKKIMADGNPSGFEIEAKENGKEVELDIDVSGKITRVELGN